MLDDTVLDHIVRSHVGASVRTWRQDRDVQNPMNVVLDVVDEVLSHPYAVYWVDGGLPEMFSLPDLEPSVVLFNTRYLEMIGHLRGILTDRALHSELLEEVAEQASLRIIAELVLRYGDPGLACHLLVESLPASTTYFLPVTLNDLERTPISLRYMVVWFYTLLHELGHVAATHRRQSDPAGGEDYLARLIEAVTSKFFGDREDDVREWRRRAHRRDSLDRQVLVEECDADLFSVQVLYEATVRVLRKNGTLDDFSVDRLAGEILLMSALMHYMNSCVMVARFGARLPAGAADPFNNVANSVRLNAITEFLSLYIATGGDVSGYADRERVDDLRADLHAIHMQINEQLTAFDRGHARAMRHGLFPEERRLDVFGRLVQAFARDPVAFVIRREVERFLALARSLEVRHPDLDLLAAVIARPTTAAAAEVLRKRQRAFLVAWVTGEGVDQPFGLPSQDAHVVFVFVTQRAVEYFIEESRPIVAPGFQLNVTGILSPTEQNVIITLFQRLPDERRQLQVVFEGTDAYADRIRQLNDGTFWSQE